MKEDVSGNSMDIDDVVRRWKNSDPPPSAGPDIWDRKSVLFGDMPPAEFGKDDFLDLIGRTCELNRDTRVLDIGCGTGRYSLALAEKTGDVAGLDFSGEMISKAVSKRDSAGIKNVSFYVDDWTKDRDDDILKEKYDLVFARYTPAVDSPKSLEKMLSVSRGMCYITMHFGNRNNIDESIGELFGERPLDRMERSALITEYLWCAGYEPQLYYEDRILDRLITPEEAFRKHSMGHFRSRVLNERTEQMVRDHLQSISVDGMIREKASERSLTIYWDVREKKVFSRPESNSL